MKRMLQLLTRRTAGMLFAVVFIAGATGCNLGGGGGSNPSKQWYVSPTGNDQNTCTTGTDPCLHINTVIQKAVSDDVIYVAAGTYLENLAVKNKPLTFVGDGIDKTIIDGGGHASVVSIDNTKIAFDSHHPFMMQLKNMTIRNGSAVKGGGINIIQSSLILDHVRITGNTATGISACGAGLYFSGSVVTSPMQIDDSKFEDNSGNGLCLEGAAVAIRRSVIQHNSMPGTGTERRGGGIYLNLGYLWMENSVIENNSAYDGGGIYMAAIGSGAPFQLNLIYVTIHGNLAEQSGGGLMLVDTSGTGTADISGSTLDGNQAIQGGGIYNAAGPLSIHESTISNNQSRQLGGGIANYGILTAVNDTLSANLVTGLGLNPSAATGGAIFNGSNGAQTGKVTASFLTIAYNAAAKGQTGGLFSTTAKSVQLRNSLMVSNAGGNCSSGLTGASSGLSTDNSCNGLGVIPDAKIKPLADNGGPTWTHRLSAGSPAIDAASSGSGDPTADQRSISRPVDGDGDGVARSDVGSFEYETLTVIPGLNKTPLVPSGIFFTPNKNAYCRSGPDEIFNSISLAMNGQAYPVDGRNADGDWFLLLLTEDVECWVPKSAGELAGEASGLRVMLPIPTPTFTPPPSQPGVDCTLNTTRQACQAVPGCTWTQLNDMFGFCSNP